jgi:Restriction endonuclease
MPFDSMRVSEHYKLGRTQGELDFVDVEVFRDTPLFVDPQAIRQLPDDWGHECVALIQDFFLTVLEAIRDGRDQRARLLLRGLREPNETRLGFSRGRPQGRALGPGSADDVWEALRDSEAAKTGLLIDLEDTILLVYGIGPDIVSDITTNLIRLPLIRYTQETCTRYGIPLKKGVHSGALWDPAKERWDEGGFTDLPVAGRRLLLCPKVIVRKRMEFDAHEYYNDYIIPYLQEQELSANSALVQVLKKRRTRYVTKKSIKEKYGNDKNAVITQTLKAPDLLERYRRSKQQTPTRPLDHVDFLDTTGSKLPDFGLLVKELRAIPKGKATADDYHKTVERLLSALFSNSLSMPQIEYPIHQGRKRIDIAYVNVGVRDFFSWLATNYSAPKIYVECKNYTGDLANQELDQLAGRFSKSRGEVGFLVCRSFKNKDLFKERCRDTAKDGRGYIVVLDDEDLAALAKLRSEDQAQAIYRWLMVRFDELIN